MSKIFLSYCSEDRENVGTIRANLLMHGYDIFWDQDIKHGQNWSETLVAKIRASDVLVVIWSFSSVVSNPVLNEVKMAQELGKSVLGVRIDEVSVPRQFSHLEATDMFDPGRRQAEWSEFLQALATLSGTGLTAPHILGSKVPKIITNRKFRLSRYTSIIDKKKYDKYSSYVLWKTIATALFILYFYFESRFSPIFDNLFAKAKKSIMNSDATLTKETFSNPEVVGILCEKVSSPGLTHLCMLNEIGLQAVPQKEFIVDMFVPLGAILVIGSFLSFALRFYIGRRRINILVANIVAFIIFLWSYNYVAIGISTKLGLS